MTRHRPAAEVAKPGLEKLISLAMARQDVAELLIAEGKKLGRQKQTAALACRAFGNAVLQLIDQARFGRARYALNCGRQIAVRYGLRAYEAGSAMLQAEIHAAAGEHAAAVDQFVDLLGGALGRHLSPSHRLHAYDMLAGVCLVAEPGDSVTCCMALAEAAWAGRDEPMPALNVCQIVETRLRQCLWSMPVFEGLIRKPVLAPEERQRLLERMERDMVAACERSAGELATLQAVFRTTLALCRSLSTGSAATALSALELLRHVDDGSAFVALELRYLVAAVLLVIGAPKEASRVAAGVHDEELANARWERQLEWLYLRSALASAESDSRRALDLYQQYVRLVSEHLAKIDFSVMSVLRRLTEMPGARPTDHREVMPAYVRRAVAMLEADPGGQTVDSLASSVGVSERTLRSAFRVYLGKSPKSLSTDLRLKRAHTHLASVPTQTGLNLSELAQEFGFSNASRFARAYAARFGRHPTKGCEA